MAAGFEQLFGPADDGFHPGDAGYALFAENALPALRDGVNTQPNTNCAQRRLYP